MKKMNKKGFTLAELLIVVAIIAVLVAIAIPVFTNQLEKSREATALSNIRAAYAEAMAEYDAIEDIPTSIPAASTRAVTFSEDSAYTLGGIPATDTSTGVIIKNKRKFMKRKR